MKKIQYRTIPGFSNYKISRNGMVMNKRTKRAISTYSNSAKTHWSGRVSITSDSGRRMAINIANLVSSAWNVQRESTIRRYLASA